MKELVKAAAEWGFTVGLERTKLLTAGIIYRERRPRQLEKLNP